MIRSLKKMLIKSLSKESYDAYGSKLDNFCFKPDYSMQSLMNNDNLYFENPCIRRGVNLIATTVANMNFVVLKNGKTYDNSYIHKLFKNPSAGVSWSDFIEGLVINYLIYGNAFVLLSKSSERLELFNLKSSAVKIVPGEHGAPKSYEYMINLKTLVFNNDSSFPFVGHLKNFNPSNHWYGISVLDAVKTSATLYQNIDLHNLSIIQNGGRPSGILAVKNGAAPLSEEEKRVIRENVIDQYKGPGNAGKIVLLNGDFEWKQMSGNSTDMDYSDAARRAVRAIAGGLGVPAVFVGEIGLEGETTRSNMNVVFDMFNKTTIFPLAKKISEFLTLFVQKLDSDLEIKLVPNMSFENESS